MAELYITISTIFRQFDFELYDTQVSDIQMKYAYLVPYPEWESKGVRVTVKAVSPVVKAE